MRKGFFAAVLLSLTACSKSNDYVIAVAMPLTGDIAGLGQGVKRAALLAYEQELASGRVTVPLRIEFYDDRSDPREAVNVANRIASNSRVIGVIGHFNSGCTIPASRVYARKGIPMLSPAASNPNLTLQQKHPSWPGPQNIFRVNTTDDVQGAYAGDFVRKALGAKRVAVLHDKTAYGQGVAEVFRKRFEELGGTLLSFDGITKGDKDFHAILTALEARNPDALYWGGDYGEGGLILKQARDRGLRMPIVCSEANMDPELIAVAGAQAEGTYLTFLGSPPELVPTARQFIEDYAKRFPENPIRAYDHYGYEATRLLLEALRAVGPDRAKILEYLRTVQHAGILGVTSFDENGDTLNRSITLFQVKGGKFLPLTNK